ncbi:MAG TPA: hypothetical protein VKF36_22640 [Syntrophorhabdales bacterium]|nr:hypothetical protein [Syntrophorhabdales bacterium]
MARILLSDPTLSPQPVPDIPLWHYRLESLQTVPLVLLVLPVLLLKSHRLLSVLLVPVDQDHPLLLPIPVIPLAPPVPLALLLLLGLVAPVDRASA